jgi:hypothetical protein
VAKDSAMMALVQSLVGNVSAISALQVGQQLRLGCLICWNGDDWPADCRCHTVHLAWQRQQQQQRTTSGSAAATAAGYQQEVQQVTHPLSSQLHE